MTITEISSVAPAVDPEFDVIELPELLDRAALPDRMDRKYLLPAASLDPVLTDLAARRRRRRFTIRTRSDLDPAPGSAACWLEVKTRDHRGHTVKQRQPHQGSPDALDQAGRVPRHPTLITRYRRRTLSCRPARAGSPWTPTCAGASRTAARSRCPE